MPTARYNAEVAAFGRQVQWLVEIVLDRCSLTYGTVAQSGCGVAADLGDGARCYYSYSTCQNIGAYTKTTKTYRFCLNNVPWPDAANPAFPYLKGFVAVAQKIDPQRLTVWPQALTCEFLLDFNPHPPDRDKTRFNTGIVGEFWRNLIARNRNYPGRIIRIKRGFNTSAFLLSDFEQIGPDYKIKEIDIAKDVVQIRGESILADISKTQVPWTISGVNTLQADIADGDTSLTVKDGTQFPDPTTISRSTVYVQIEAEVLKVSSIATNTLTVVRGQLGTTAAAHKKGQKLSHIVTIGSASSPRTPTDAILDILEWAKVPSASINTTAFDAIRDGYWSGADLNAKLSKPMSATEIITRIREPRALLIYTDTTGKITCGVIGPQSSTQTLTDDNFVLDSVSVNEDQDARITRMAFWYDPDSQDQGSQNKITDQYHRGVVAIDASLEQTINYGDSRAETITDAFLDPNVGASRVYSMAKRMITRRGNGVRTIIFRTDLKNAGIAIGEVVSITTKQILSATGAADTRQFLISSRKETTPSTVEFEGIDLSISGRFLRIMSNSATDSYDSASQAEKDSGGYWGDASDNTVGTANDAGYVFW